VSTWSIRARIEFTFQVAMRRAGMIRVRGPEVSRRWRA
jgi:hypothetical protein